VTGPNEAGRDDKEGRCLVEEGGRGITIMSAGWASS
jgi:hypothetical protein